MADRSHIEWTDATWNPLVGCHKVSPGCDNCYAEGVVNRFAGTSSAFPNRFDVVTMRGPRMLEQPLRWSKPRRVFVNSLSDLFHADVQSVFIAQVFAVMALAQQHSFQLLTKRHGRMRSLLNDDGFLDAVSGHMQELGSHNEVPDVGWPLPNVWLGVSVEDQKWADLRVPALLDTPAAVRWISAEPLLGPVDLRLWLRQAWDAWKPSDPFTAPLDWVVVGGESGRNARPMHPDWPRSLRDQCETAGVPFLMKQWGEWHPAPWKLERLDGETDAAYKVRSEAEAATHAVQPWGHFLELSHRPWSVERTATAPHPAAGLRRPGKRAAGRELDGRLHDGYPAPAAPPPDSH